MQCVNWNDLYNHKLQSPFIPKLGDNFDKQYCEGQEVLGEETIARYQDYIQDSEYIDLFNNYTFISNIKWNNPTNNYNINNSTLNANNSNNIQVESTTQVSTPSSRIKITKKPFPGPLCNQYSTSSIFNQGSYLPGHNLISPKEITKPHKSKIDLFLGKSMSMKMIPKSNVKEMEINCINDITNITDRKNSQKIIGNNAFVNNFLTQQKQNRTFVKNKKVMHPYALSSNTSRPGSPPESEDRAIINNYNKKSKALKTIDIDKNLPLISFIQKKLKNTNRLFSPLSMKNIKDDHSLNIAKSSFKHQKIKPKIKFESINILARKKFIGLHYKSNSAFILEKLYKK